MKRTRHGRDGASPLISVLAESWRLTRKSMLRQVTPLLLLSALTADPSAGAAARVGRDSSACAPRNDAESIASSLIDVLTRDDERAAQFALDSLRLVRSEALPLLVCHLEDVEALEIHENLYWLNRGPHFELFAHYRVTTVADAMALVLGSPPGSSAACDGRTKEGRAQCRSAWDGYLALKGRKPTAPRGPELH